MAHYAYLNQSNVVTSVIVGKDESSDFDWESYYGNGLKCKRTSYNTRGGIHTQNGTPFRKNYAGIGYFYDESMDAFIPPKPFESWILDIESCLWYAPIERPNDGKAYYWDELNKCWKEQVNDII